MKSNEDIVPEILGDIFKEVSPEVIKEDLYDEQKLNQSLRDDLNLDSYDLYRVMELLSERANVHLTDRMMLEIRTLKELLVAVTKLYCTTHPPSTTMDWPVT